MADVVVNIRGNADQLKRELESVSKDIPDVIGREAVKTERPRETVGGEPRKVDYKEAEIPTYRYAPTNLNVSETEESDVEAANFILNKDRIAAEMRSEVLKRSMEVPIGTSYKSLIHDAKIQQEAILKERIESKYDERHEEVYSHASEEKKVAEKTIDTKKQEYISQDKEHYEKDPLFKASVDRNFEDRKRFEYQKIDEKYYKEHENLEGEENNEKSKSQEELIQALRDLTEEYRGGRVAGGTPGAIETGRRKIRTAVADDYGKEGTEIPREITKKTDERLANISRGSQNIFGTIGAIESENAGGIVEQGGMGALNLAGMAGVSAKALSRIVPAIAIAAAGTKLIQSGNQSIEGISDLASIRGAMGGQTGLAGLNYAVTATSQGLLGANDTRGVSYTDFGLGQQEFSDMAAARIRRSGVNEDWFNRTMYGISLERQFGLSKGRLNEAAQYDRYGQETNNAVAQMVLMQSALQEQGISNSGVSLKDFTRVPEKVETQQSIMAGYMGRVNAPSYEDANKLLTAFSATPGIIQDARMTGDIQQFQSMVQNPMNDRMKALVYGTVSDLFPQTGNRMDLIEREIHKTENEGTIMKAVIERVAAQYGDTKTTMGYYAFKNLLPNIPDDKRDAYIEAILNGTTGTIMENGVGKKEEWATVTENLKGQSLLETSGLVTEMTKDLKDLKTGLQQIYQWLSNHYQAPLQPPTPKTGK